MNRNPTWKYLLLLLLVAFGVIYATPNLYVAEPGVQVLGVRDTEVNENTLAQITRALEQNDIELKSISLDNGVIKARLTSEEAQSNARDVLKESLGDKYGIAFHAAALYQTLREHQPNQVEFRVIDGDHEWAVWAGTLPEALTYIFRFSSRPIGLNRSN